MRAVCAMLEENLVMFSVEISGERYNQWTVTGPSSLIVDSVWDRIWAWILTGVFWHGNNLQIESVQVEPRRLLSYHWPRSYEAERAERELIQEGRDGLWGRDTHQCLTTESRPVHLPDRHTYTHARTYTKTLLLLLWRRQKKKKMGAGNKNLEEVSSIFAWVLLIPSTDKLS